MASFDRLTESRWAYPVLAAIVFFLALPGLLSMPVMDRDEGRFAEASSEMLESGDFVVIRYHGDLRNKKPVAIHWMQAATVGLTSGAHARDIGAYRLPSLFGAMLAAMATMWAGSSLFNRRAAFIGALLLGTCLLLTTEAHIAKTDAAQCGILTLGMAALARLRAGVGGKKAMSTLFWICLAIGVLLKGVIAPLVMGTTVVGLLLWERKYDWAKPLLHWLGISLFCIITIPWYVAVQIATEGEFLFEAAAVDLGQKIVSAAEGHKGPPGMHTAALPLLFWPGTLLLIPGIWLAVSKLAQMRRNGGGKTGEVLAFDGTEAAAWRFLACWVVPSWIVFELAPTKLVHYTLPMYPAFALMAGAAADRWFSTGEWTRGRWISLGIFLVVSTLLAAVAAPSVLAYLRADAAADFSPLIRDRVAFEWEQAWNATGIWLWPTILIGLAAAGTAYFFFRKMAVGVLAGLLACSIVGGIGYRAVILPNQSWILSTEAALSALKEVCALPEGSSAWQQSGCEGRAPKVIRAMAFAEPSFVFHLGDQIYLPPASNPAIPSLAEDNRPAWLINVGEEEGRKALDGLLANAAAADRCVRLARRYAMNYSNGDPSILVAAVVEPGGCPSSGPPPELRDTSEPDDPELDN
ncbi:MAG TPA: glycosyltransferase family 39 protein [Hyphomonadaceae bacterium]|nr:glycosyltransferase family 39 protein [Hyphomonadaceae bacterium]